MMVLKTFSNFAINIKIMSFKKIIKLFLLSFFISSTTFIYGQDIKKLSIVKSSAIDQILLKKKLYNAKNPPMGYKIQLYYGDETIAYKIKKKFENNFPTQNAKIIFATPDWKVMVGNFKKRINADSTLIAIKKKFVGAVVVSTPISIK